MFTKEKFTQLIAKDPEVSVHAIGRALVHLLDRQTAEESRILTTKVKNGMGFTPGDARIGSIAAKYYIKHKTLEDWQAKYWKKLNAKGDARIVKYWRQLAEEVQKKQEKKQ